MATATLPESPPAPAAQVTPYSIGAGVLSYLVPGLGQIAQGRVAKGLLFLICIYALFFYGVYLGTGSIKLNGETYRVSSNVYLPDAAVESVGQEKQWPALMQNLYTRPQFAGQFFVGVAAWPAIVQYWNKTAPQPRRGEDDAPIPDGHPVLKDFMREPNAEAVNAVHNAGDKRLELAWVYTVIAGVLNILVIYDAIAGPAFGLGVRPPDEKE